MTLRRLGLGGRGAAAVPHRKQVPVGLVRVRESAFPELPDDPFLPFQVLPDLRLRLVPVSGDLFPGAVEKPVESRVYHSGMLAVVLPEGSGFTAIVQPARQGALAVRALGDLVGLLVGEYLDLVLDVAKEPVGAAQGLALRPRDVAAAGQLGDRFERVSFPDAGVVPAIHELQGLSEEFDLADAAVPELEVPLPGVVAG